MAQEQARETSIKRLYEAHYKYLYMMDLICSIEGKG